LSLISCDGDLAAQQAGQLIFQFGLEQRSNDPKTEDHIEQEQPRDNQADFFSQFNAFVFLVPIIVS
jgi:hypothetical protein